MILYFSRQIAKKIEEYKVVAKRNEEELTQKNYALKQQLYLDDLTKLHNLKAFDHDIKKVKKPKVILLDIDSFKEINEFYGKNNGDLVLIEIAKMIKEFAEEYSMKAYRVGSDEFVFLDAESLDISKYESIAVELVETFKTKESEINFS